MKTNISIEDPYKYTMAEGYVMTMYIFSEKELSEEWIKSTFAKYRQILQPNKERPVQITIKVLSKDTTVISTPKYSLRLVEAIELA